MEKVCFVCLRPSRLKCSRCLTIQYCSKECQMNDWKTHKNNCNECDNNATNDELLWGKAKNYILQGNYIKAEKLVLKLSKRYQNMTNHRELTIINMCVLAKTYESRGKYLEAEPLHLKCYEYYMQKLGPNHSKTLIAMNYLAFCYLCQKKIYACEPIFQDCYERYKSTVGEDHPEAIMVMNFIGETSAMSDKFEEAEEIFRRCLNKAKIIFGESSSLPSFLLYPSLLFIITITNFTIIITIIIVLT